jgi:hypothetical protein
MGLNAEEISQHYPYLYHMAESGSWPSIKKRGLLSTTALLDLFDVKGNERDAIESRCREESKIVQHKIHGTAVIRGQMVLPETKLEYLLLDGMTPREYYRLLNRKTFFWVRRERLEGLLRARPYRGRSHTVLTVDTKDLVTRYEKKIWLSRINSGAAIYGVGKRGSSTFHRIRDYPFEENKKKKKEDAIVELAVDYAVKDISELTVRVEEWFENKPIRTIWVKGQ